MKKKLLLLLIIFASLCAQARWLDSKGKPLPDKPSRQTVGDFGAQVMMTADAKRFVEQWKTLPLPTKMDKAKSIRRSETITAVVLFFGCTPNKTGKCDVVADLTLVPPSGPPSAPLVEPVWQDAAPPEKATAQLGRLRMNVAFQPSDPLGKYKVLATVTDKVSGKTAPITTSFMLEK